MSSSSLKITDNTNEMSFHDLFSQSVQVRIPLFQREYVWTEQQLKRMLEEIDIIYDGQDKSRFLGAVIAVGGDPNPATLFPYEIVDGQQRLSTLYLFVLAAAYVAGKAGHTEYALGIVNAYLASIMSPASVNVKLQTSFADRAQFVAAFNQITNLGNLSDQLGPRIRLPAATGKSSGRLLNQFNRIRKALAKRLDDLGPEQFQELVTIAVTRLTFVFIMLKDASTATTIFEGLNDPGIPIGIGDLVRNEVFSKLSTDPDLAIHIHSTVWLPFKEKLGDQFDNYFFPFGIIQDPSLKQADLFRSLRGKWKGLAGPKEIIEQLDQYTQPFLCLTKGECAHLPKPVAAAIARLRAASLPSSTYPFLMKMLKELEAQNVEEAGVISCLQGLEAFLVRRAIAGIEPTGLLVFFRTAWTAISGKPSWESFRAALSKRGTIEWPDDDRVLAGVKTRKIYKSAIRNYLLTEYDRSLGADVPSDPPWIEHVLPQKLPPHWKHRPNGDVLFSEGEHSELADTWGNLVCLSSKMNIELSQAPYPDKRKVYEKSSMYRSARQLAEQYDDWTPDTIRQRSGMIGAWVLTRWPNHTGMSRSKSAGLV